MLKVILVIYPEIYKVLDLCIMVKSYVVSCSGNDVLSFLFSSALTTFKRDFFVRTFLNFSNGIWHKIIAFLSEPCKKKSVSKFVIFSWADSV